VHCSSCDLDGNGTVDREELEQAILLQSPSATPEAFVERMLEAAGVKQMLLQALLESAHKRYDEPFHPAIFMRGQALLCTRERHPRLTLK
jgi:hypothetical protein